MPEDRDSGHVPTWDGAAKGWRRYTREVSWYVQSTPRHKRKHCTARLMSRLTGPARLLAMSWPRAIFDGSGGTRAFLQKLASSPLVRKTLLNAAAIFQQYFSFRRGQQESIGNFLVRETLVHEEFVEAIIRLHEAKLGVSQAERDFGIPDDEDDWDYAYDDWGDDGWVATTPMRSSVMVQLLPATLRIELQDMLPEKNLEQALVAAAPGSSPNRPEVRQRRLLQDEPTAAASGPTQAIDELTMADSFIMNVLRGWRLLQAAGLTAEEKRAILSTTRNSLDHDVVSQALQGLWDDQLLGSSSNYNANYADHQGFAAYQDDLELCYQDEEWPGDEWWPHYQAFYGGQDPGDDGDWWGDGGDYHLQAATEDPDFEADEKLKEALKTEKLAEGMASEAHRTWTEAQRATQALSA